MLGSTKIKDTTVPPGQRVSATPAYYGVKKSSAALRENLSFFSRESLTKRRRQRSRWPYQKSPARCLPIAGLRSPKKSKWVRFALISLGSNIRESKHNHVHGAKTKNVVKCGDTATTIRHGTVLDLRASEKSKSPKKTASHPHALTKHETHGGS